jgi:hypothetical protein
MERGPSERGGAGGAVGGGRASDTIDDDIPF